GQLGVEDLDGDLAPEGQIVTPVDAGHAALADDLIDAVAVGEDARLCRHVPILPQHTLDNFSQITRPNLMTRREPDHSAGGGVMPSRGSTSAAGLVVEVPLPDISEGRSPQKARYVAGTFCQAVPSSTTITAEFVPGEKFIFGSPLLNFALVSVTS